MMLSWRNALAVLCLATLASPLAQAQSDSASGDIERGKERFYTCLGCHGIPEYKNAYPMYHVPKIAGQHATYIETALKAYRSGERSHPTMRAQASSMSDEAIRDIAAYLSQLERR